MVLLNNFPSMYLFNQWILWHITSILILFSYFLHIKLFYLITSKRIRLICIKKTEKYTAENKFLLQSIIKYFDKISTNKVFPKLQSRIFHTIQKIYICRNFLIIHIFPVNADLTWRYAKLIFHMSTTDKQKITI